MDDLDRLFRRLVLNVQQGAPQLLERQFKLGDVAAHLVPYRHSRRDLGFESIQQYEVALMRLAAGERGYLRADAPVQEALRRALAGPQPDGDLLRAHAEAPVALAHDALARADATGAAQHAASTANADGGRAFEARGVGDLPPAPAAADLERAVVASRQVTDAWSELARATPSAAAVPVPPPVPPPPPLPEPPPLRAEPATKAAGGERGEPNGCRYCGQPLPEGRRVTFCPYCGNNLTVRQCPACSTELEVGWRFCITCGRTMDEGGVGDAGDAGDASPAAR